MSQGKRQAVYMTQSEQSVQASISNAPTQLDVDNNYSYEVDVDKNLAKKEEELLNSELNADTTNEEDDFFKDFMAEKCLLQFGRIQTGVFLCPNSSL